MLFHALRRVSYAGVVGARSILPSIFHIWTQQAGAHGLLAQHHGRACFLVLEKHILFPFLTQRETPQVGPDTKLESWVLPTWVRWWQKGQEETEDGRSEPVFQGTVKLFPCTEGPFSLWNISTACVFGSISRLCVTLALPMGADGSDSGDLRSSRIPANLRNDYTW